MLIHTYTYPIIYIKYKYSKYISISYICSIYICSIYTHHNEIFTYKHMFEYASV